MNSIHTITLRQMAEDFVDYHFRHKPWAIKPPILSGQAVARYEDYVEMVLERNHTDLERRMNEP